MDSRPVLLPWAHHRPAPVDVADLSEAYRAYQPTLAVIDGVTEATTMYGLNPNDNKDIATFGRALPRPLAAAGALGGIGVHIGARVSALAGPNDVLVSSTLRDLVIGLGLEFEERGSHERHREAPPPGG